MAPPRRLWSGHARPRAGGARGGRDGRVRIPGIGVATEGTVHFGINKSLDHPDREPMSMMTRAILLLATEPLDRVTGRVTYSQQILQEFGWIEGGEGLGIDRRGSGYSEI